ncbi:MAG: sulfotransferase domain-containing protein [Anaerolineales bacterium]|nr:sulfotransferase domain-containing protein [Anaerolineales bacterium]
MTTKESALHLPPILVTGAHRTGTTWVGKMLGAGGDTAYISEPLNVWRRPGVMRVPVSRWYTYICEENESDYIQAFQEMLGLQYHIGREILSLRSGRDFLRMGRDWFTFLQGRLEKRRPLLKDPFAVFSSLWFAKQLHCQVVITIRHPAAFASSLKRLNWRFDLQDLLDQPLLMRDWLEPFRDELSSVKPDDIITQASLLWKIIYKVVSRFQSTHADDLFVVRHEDLSLEPLDGFRELYSKLGLDFSQKAMDLILRSTSENNPKELSKQSVHQIRLDSRANLYNWKHRLSADELRQIRKITAKTAGTYYPDENWN